MVCLDFTSVTLTSRTDRKTMYFVSWFGNFSTDFGPSKYGHISNLPILLFPFCHTKQFLTFFRFFLIKPIYFTTCHFNQVSSWLRPKMSCWRFIYIGCWDLRHGLFISKLRQYCKEVRLQFAKILSTTRFRKLSFKISVNVDDSHQPS